MGCQSSQQEGGRRRQSRREGEGVAEAGLAICALKVEERVIRQGLSWPLEAGKGKYPRSVNNVILFNVVLL